MPTSARSNAAQINANFNANLGLNADCLRARVWYLGLDGNHGTNIDFVTVLLHEMGHGLGFQTFTNGSTGAQSGGFPSIWDHFLFGTVTGKLWNDMTNAERAASAISGDKLVWTGASASPRPSRSVLRFGLASATFSGPAAGASPAGAGRRSRLRPVAGIAADLRRGDARWSSRRPGAGLRAATPSTPPTRWPSPARSRFIDRGVCTFAIKTKNAQNAGAIAVLIADNAAGACSRPGLGGRTRR